MRWPRRCSMCGSGSTCPLGSARWPRSDIKRCRISACRAGELPLMMPRARVGAFGLRSRGPMVEQLVHARCHALLAQRFFVFLAQKGILQPIRNGGAALGHVDGAFVGIFLARHPRLVFAMVVGTVPAN